MRRIALLRDKLRSDRVIRSIIDPHMRVFLTHPASVLTVSASHAQLYWLLVLYAVTVIKVARETHGNNFQYTYLVPVTT